MTQCPSVTALPALILAGLLSSCTLVGPDFRQPGVEPLPDWYSAEAAELRSAVADLQPWWQQLADPQLDALIKQAQQANNSLELAGLRVLEARAELGIALGSRYPQTQVIGGSATAVRASENAANTAAGDLKFSDYGVGATASWEIDFWGRFRRGIEAADATLLASEAAYDQALLLVTSQVALTYLAIRSTEEQIAITLRNIASQQRSFDIVKVQFDNGTTSELDVLQAEALLLGTRSTLPALETALRQAYHALDTLLGSPPGAGRYQISAAGGIPVVPTSMAIGYPADVLRQRPDVQAAEYVALAQNAAVGLATADLYPSFSLAGSVGLAASGSTNTTRSGVSGFDELFSSDSLTYSAGPSFVWPFLNYGRIKNNIRVQDARLQQALTSYRETVIQAAREVEDTLVALQQSIERRRILERGVAVANRATEMALLRYKEGFADYQRVLDAQTSQFAQQNQLVTARTDIVNAFIALQVALGNVWRDGRPDYVPRETLELMQQRTDWGDLLQQEE